MRKSRAITVPVFTVSLLCAAAVPAHAAIGFGATIQVTTANDEFNNGSAGCSLREAVQTANLDADFGGCTHTGSFATGPNADKILLPAANPGYPLARTGGEEDNNERGDLDFRSNITLQGAGAGTTPIFVCADCPERVIDVISGSNVEINDVTLKFGKVPGAGGGLFVDLDATVTATRVTIGLNTAVTNGGGVFNRGRLTFNNSAIGNNTTLRTANGGGGIFNGEGAELTLNDSRVLNNTTAGDDADGHGAGIHNFIGGTVVLNDTTVDGNTIAVKQTLGGSARGNGGGIYNQGSLALHQSSVTNNIASGKSAEGGGIFCTASATLTLVERSVVSFNDVIENSGVGAESNNGGGIGIRCANAVVRDSVISNNRTDIGSGGGVFVGDGGSVRILNSTIAQNFARTNGGGVAATGVNDDAAIALVNTTVINNSADGNGGGGAFEGLAIAQLRSATVVTNNANANGFGDGFGGGLFSRVATGQVIRMGLGNTVLAGNTEDGSTNNDCDGLLSSFGYNLVQSTARCALTNAIGDIEGFSAGLAAATNNGGPTAGAANGVIAGMLTRAPLGNSALIDAGNPNGCRDELDQLLPTDQIERERNQDGGSPLFAPACDIGAVEFTFRIFANGME